MHSKDAGDAQGTSNVRDVYVEALRELRQDAGCTPERLLKYPELHAALAQRVQRGGSVATPEACVTELGELIKRLGDPLLRDILLAAMRLDPRFQEPGVTKRRISFQASLKNHSDPAARAMHTYNLRQFGRREDEAIHGVASFLAVQEEHERFEPRPNQDAPQPQEATSGTIEASLFPIVNSNFLTYKFNSLGVLHTQEVVKQLYATQKETARTSSWETAYFADRRQGVLSTESDFGWRLLEAVELDDGTLDVTFELPRELNPEDGLYSVGYHTTAKSEKRCSPIVYWEPVKGSRQVDFRLIFDPKMRPVRAWWFIARTRGDAVREPDASTGRHIEVFDCGTHLYVHKYFESSPELAPHHVHGVAWIWQGD